MGAQVELRLERHGFYPAGGGIVTAAIEPCARLNPTELPTCGVRCDADAEAFVAGIPASVGRCELACIGRGMGWDEAQLRLHVVSGEQGPGTAVLLTLEQST